MIEVTDPTAIAFDYWDNYPTDNPFLLNGFKGTFAFSEHLLIPEALTEFLIEKFRPRLKEGRKNHIQVIPLEEINDVLNDIWEGPGSMSKVVRETYQMKYDRTADSDDDTVTTSVFKGYEAPTYESNLNPNAVDRIEK